ncbi:nitrate- and nitrite sensing domain-containing protein [Streptomyces sp. NPDC086787]|uniref:nitrate- and nitrite sensing domain-containing protein n=1 Tax=Streptomyces sp. NPDC086787 TaxID=3365759 RepID=UPI00380C0B6B
MRFRGKSIRRKIVALLLVPLVSLTAVWGFTTVLTGRQAAALMHVSDVVEGIAYPTEDTVRLLQEERRQTLVYLADPRAADVLTALRQSRTATDRAAARIRNNAQDSSLRELMDADGTERMTALLDALGGIDALRRNVEEGAVTRSQALGLYNRVVESCFSLLSGLDGIKDVELDRQARAIVTITRARELLSREDALLGSALVVGKLSRAETRYVSDLVAQRELLYEISTPMLPPADRDRYDRFWKSATTTPLHVAEQTVIKTGSGTPRGVSAKSWDAAAGSTLDELHKLNDQLADRFQDRVDPVAQSVIVQAVVAGALGLVALLLSIFLSVRIGRGLIRDLRQLRLDAHEASGVRLPGVMRRLSAGEKVDVETEAPLLEHAENEIGEVGQALNTLQRAAVEAAVKQAELRAGVSEVFVNLARRSQVLLHKQLTLLDTMERRTEDTDELADLFRLDHLTTRMRRHAEGLVILSGAAPSRQWRKPVQLMDVVRAAVAEVEDYERIEVRRLPRIAVKGPAVADLTHLVAELLENATVFSPPHTAVQVLGERVANGFTLEIHDRGLGMPAEALLDANLRLAETPEFELSDTDRLGLFVVSRLAQRQHVSVSLQPSPYGGTTAVVFVPEALLTSDTPDTNGIGFRLDRVQPLRQPEAEQSRGAGLTQVPARMPSLTSSLLDGPVELEPPVELDTLDDFPGALTDADSERGGLFRPRRRSAARTPDAPLRQGEPHRKSPGVTDPPAAGDRPTGGVPLPRRGTPKLVSSHGRPVGEERAGRRQESEENRTGPHRSEPEAPLAPLPSRRRGETSRYPGSEPADRADGSPASPGTAPDETFEAPTLPRRNRRSAISSAGDPDAAAPLGGGSPWETGPAGSAAEPEALPRRVRQASLAPQLRQDPEQRTDAPTDPVERDADEVRGRMASLQRGWQRGRRDNTAGDGARNGPAQGTTEGNGR